MSDRNTIERKLALIHELIEPIAGELGLKLLEVRFAQTGRKRTLEVTIFKPGDKISLTDCENLSRLIEKEFDRAAESGDEKERLVDGAYLLEVQSPGIDRRLKTEREYALFSGETVQVQTKEQLSDLGSVFTGVLDGIEAGKLRLKQARPVVQKKTKGSPGKKETAQGCEEKHEVLIDISNLLHVKLHAGVI